MLSNNINVWCACETRLHAWTAGRSQDFVLPGVRLCCSGEVEASFPVAMTTSTATLPQLKKTTKGVLLKRMRRVTECLFTWIGRGRSATLHPLVQDHHCDSSEAVKTEVRSQICFKCSWQVPPAHLTFVGPRLGTGLGLSLSASGLLVTMLGVTMFFNTGLLRLGNLLFLAGLPLIIGPRRTVAYFSHRARLRATSTFLIGAFLVIFAGWPVCGLFVEGFGFLNLFGNFFPLISRLIRYLPFAEDILGRPHDDPFGGGI